MNFPAYQLDIFDQWQTVPLAAELCGIPERRLHWWIDHDVVPHLEWCGMKIVRLSDVRLSDVRLSDVRLRDVRLAVATPAKRGRPAKN